MGWVTIPWDSAWGGRLKHFTCCYLHSQERGEGKGPTMQPENNKNNDGDQTVQTGFREAKSALPRVRTQPPPPQGLCVGWAVSIQTEMFKIGAKSDCQYPQVPEKQI